LKAVFFASRRGRHYTQCVVYCAVVRRDKRVVFVVHTDVAVEREVEGGLLLADMGCGMPFRPGTFDGVIRLCYIIIIIITLIRLTWYKCESTTRPRYNRPTWG